MIRDLYTKLEYDESKLCLQYICMLHVHVCAAFVPTAVQCTVGLGGKKRDLCYENNSKQSSNMGIRHVCLHTKHAVNGQTLFKNNSRNRKVCIVTM